MSTGTTRSNVEVDMGTRQAARRKNSTPSVVLFDKAERSLSKCYRAAREMGNVGVRAFPREGCNQQQHGTNPERHK